MHCLFYKLQFYLIIDIYSLTKLINFVLKLHIDLLRYEKSFGQYGDDGLGILHAKQMAVEQI